MNLFDYVWLVFFVLILYYQFRPKLLEQRRLRLIKRIEESRGSRVISIIQPPSSASLIGLFSGNYINLHDSLRVLQAVRDTPKDKPIDLILHTPGGLVLASWQIAHALTSHPSKVTVYVPHFAMSGGTYLALSADQIVMDPNAVLGRIDPQILGFSAMSISSVTSQKPAKNIDDKTLILADISKKAIKQVRDYAKSLLLSADYSDADSANIIDHLVNENYTHDHPVSYEEARDIGLRISTDIPDLIYQLIDLTTQESRRQESVQFISADQI